MTLGECFSGSLTRKVVQTVADEKIVEFVVQGVHPLSTVDQPAFINLIKSECPLV